MTHAEYMRLYRRNGLVPLQKEWLPAEPLLSRLRQLQKISKLDKRTEKAVWRAGRVGKFTVSQADELCVNVLKSHPGDIYGDEWWA